MKFPKSGSKEPLLTLGEKFVPGSDTKHFCKPTSTAVDEEGMKCYLEVYKYTIDCSNFFVVFFDVLNDQ